MQFLQERQRSVYFFLFFFFQFSTTRRVGMAEMTNDVCIDHYFFSSLENEHLRNNDSPKLLNRTPYRMVNLNK